MSSTYQERKQATREEAMEWQDILSECSCSYGELLEIEQHLSRLAKRYGLVQEFRENGIC